MFEALFKKNKSLPSFFKPLLWSYDFSKIDSEKDKERIIINTINYGNLGHWRWVAKSYGKDTIAGILKNIPVSEFRPRALGLASIIFSVKDFNYASRSVK